MKIAYFVTVFPCVSETFVHNQITGLIDLGHEVNVYSRWRGDEVIHPDVRTYGLLDKVSYWPSMPRNFKLCAAKASALLLRHGWRMPVRLMQTLNCRRFGVSASSLDLLFSAIPLLRSGRSYDVVHCQFAPNGVYAAGLKELGIITGKLFTTFHDVGLTTYANKWGERVFEHLFSVGDLFFATSERDRERLVTIGCPRDKVRVHRTGVDCALFTPHSDRKRDGSSLRILSVGRLVEKKGFEYGIRAIAELKRRGIACEYDVVGGGPLEEMLRDLAKTLGVDDCVRFHGAQARDYILSLHRNANVFAAPSVTARNAEQEVIPIVLMEAMASGLPVVSTHHASIAELVEDNVSGFLVPERDAGALADRLALLTEDEELRRQMGSAGRRIAEKLSDIDKLNRQLAATFEEVLSGSSGEASSAVE